MNKKSAINGIGRSTGQIGRSNANIMSTNDQKNDRSREPKVSMSTTSA